MNQRQTAKDEPVKIEQKTNIPGDGVDKDYPEAISPNTQATPQYLPGDIVRQPRTNEKYEFVVILEDGSPSTCRYYTDALILSRLVKQQLIMEHLMTFK